MSVWLARACATAPACAADMTTRVRRRSVVPGVVAAVGLLLHALPGSAQSLPQQNQQVLEELRAIRQLLERLAGPLVPGNSAPPAPPAAAGDKVALASFDGPFLGRADAPLTMVEFTDLQCPFCRQFHVTTFEQIKKEYIDTGKLRYYSRDFPLENIHPMATTAARASRCAALQGKFWEMRHAILINNAQLTAGVFGTLAQDLKLNVPSFTACAADASRFGAELQKDMSEAAAAGVSGTPSFVIGRTRAGGLDGVRLVGAQPYAAFDSRLKELLAGK